MSATAEIKASLPPLGILAGGGVLPALVYQACQAQGRPCHLIRLKGQWDDVQLAPLPATDARMEQFGVIFGALSRHKVRDLVLIGRVRRPSLLEIKPDFKALSMLPQLMGVLRHGGDDTLLRRVRQLLEGQGFNLVAVQDIVSHIRVPAGVLGQFTPDSAHLADIKKGLAVARVLGALDVGQAVVVQQGLVLGVEGVEGTDALIARCAGYKRAGPAPVLVKCVKPQQDRALDLPTIGPETLKNCAAAGFAGVAVEAHFTLVADIGATVACADAAHLFLTGVDSHEP